MKKSYETPSVEVVKFQYRDQVVAASGIGGSYTCRKETTHFWDGNLQASKDDFKCHTGCYDSVVGDQHYQ